MRTLRGRLLVYLGMAVAFSTLLTVLVAAFLTRRHVESQALEVLGNRADLVAAALEQTSDPRAERRLRLFFESQGQILALPSGNPPPARLLHEAALATGAERGRLEVLGSPYLFVVRQTSAGPVVLAAPAAEGGDRWRPLFASLLLSGGAGALVALGLASLLARRLTRPIGELLAATREVASGGTSRVAVEGEDELARLAEGFNEMADRLATAREAQRSFLMSVSHELKTPLAAIRGYTEAIEDGVAPPSAGVAIIAREAGRLERLVRDLLDLARLDARRFSVREEQVDLTAVVGDIEERYRPHAEELGVAIAVEAEGSPPVLADRDRLLQVVSNLVENALRSASRTVVVRAEDGRITVIDDGPGLSPDDLPRAFERFYLYERHGQDRPVGSGLGLALVKELTEAMGGRVQVESRPGQGTSFTVSLRPVR